MDLRKVNNLVADNVSNNKPRSENFVRRIATLDREVSLLKGSLLPGLSLFADGGSTFSRNACIKICQQNFSHKGNAQSLKRSVSAFSGFMREYVDLVVKADKFPVYMDDVGFAANFATISTGNFRAVFECIRKTRLKITVEKCQFGFLGRRP